MSPAKNPKPSRSARKPAKARATKAAGAVKKVVSERTRRMKELNRLRRSMVEELRRLRISPKERARLVRKVKDVAHQARSLRDKLHQIEVGTRMSLDELRVAAREAALHGKNGHRGRRNGQLSPEA